MMEQKRRGEEKCNYGSRTSAVFLPNGNENLLAKTSCAERLIASQYPQPRPSASFIDDDELKLESFRSTRKIEEPPKISRATRLHGKFEKKK